MVNAVSVGSEGPLSWPGFALWVRTLLSMTSGYLLQNIRENAAYSMGVAASTVNGRPSACQGPLS